MKKKGKTMSLFSKEAIRRLQKDGFTGRLFVEWKDGMINDLELKTSFMFQRQEKEILC
jgi:hypothetical protein